MLRKNESNKDVKMEKNTDGSGTLWGIKTMKESDIIIR
jgi:hypothetical protein